MKKISLLFTCFLLTLLFGNLIPAQASTGEVYAGNAPSNNSVYTLSETVYDEESGKLAYQKITYDKNTYSTTLCTQLDAAGGSVEVSNDAQYVFLPARYLRFNDDTSISFKYKNNGVQKIVLHAEYYAGISQGGVDYESGYKLVCMNAISSAEAWNVTPSKSADGYDVTTILFGNYVNEIYDFTLIGFRLYFDYGLSVTEERSFEIFGYEIHESNIVPTFASDPKPTRFSKLSSEDVTIENNSFVVETSANVSAKIYDYTIDNYALIADLNLDNSATINFELDGNIVLTKNYNAGNHNVRIDLTENNYSLFNMNIIANNTKIIVKTLKFLSPSYVDVLSGTGYEVSESDGVMTVNYSHYQSWNKLSGVIRNYNEDYQYLSLKFNLSHPIVMGIYLDNNKLRDHWTYKDPLPAGEHEILIDISCYDIASDASTLIFYLDPENEAFVTVDAEKTIIFNELKLLRADDLPKAEINVDESYEFTYNGMSHNLANVTANPSLPLTFEYKLENASDDEYTTSAPIDAGTYEVRISTPFSTVDNITYGKTIVYTKLVINKASVDKPLVSDITVDYANNRIYYDNSLFVVATDENYTNIIDSGSYLLVNSTLYVKYISSNNFNESQTLTIDLLQEEKFNVTIDYIEEMTVEIIPTTVEYSTDGLNWINGNNERITVEANKIYMFRTKATSTSLASEKSYISVERLEPTANLELEKTRPTSIILVSVEGAEYRINDGEWQDSNEFTGLTYGTEVEVFMRMKATNTSYKTKEVSFIVKVGVGVQTTTSTSVINENSLSNGTLYSQNISNMADELPENTYIVTNYTELYEALSGTSNDYLTTIVISGSIVLTYDLTISGKVILIGENNAELIFENENSKRRISNDLNAEIVFENIKFTRTVVDDNQTYVFEIRKNGNIWFVECEFNVAIAGEEANMSVDRVTYMEGGVTGALYFDNCIFNTKGYIYRGTIAFYNTDIEQFPATYDVTIIDLRKFKIDYDTKTFTFPSTYKVSKFEDFSSLLTSGSIFESATTYYISNGEDVITYTTKDIKLDTPTIKSLEIDYTNETISFDSKYLVSKNIDFTELYESGDKIVPGDMVYVKEVATGIYMDSDVAEIILPTRPEVIKLEVEYICSFGFVIQYYPNAIYSINGQCQASPVFVGLEEGDYEVTIFISATENSFASEAYKINVTISE